MNEKKTKPRREPTYDGLTHEELARSLGLDELTPGAICFGKDKGRWKIVATIQRGG